MALNIQVLSDNRLVPTVFNVIQGSNNIDTVVYTMENYIVGEQDLSTYDWYVHLFGVEGVDAVKLTSIVVDGKLQVTFDLTEYVTRLGNTLTYQLVAKDDKSAVWNSAKGVILNAESINADDKIVAEYASILRQWELRIEEMAGSLDTAIYYIPYGETIPKEDRMPGRLYYQYLYSENFIGQLEDSNGNILIPEAVAKNIGLSAIDGLTASTVQEALQALKVLIENKDSLPAQSGNDGKYLRTNGETAEWADVDSLPAQANNEGKYLKTNGETAEWADAPGGLPLLSSIWADHKLNDVSWLRADTFSWQSGDVYKAVYNHLAEDVNKIQQSSVVVNGTAYYKWKLQDGVNTYWTLSTTPAIGDTVYSYSDGGMSSTRFVVVEIGTNNIRIEHDATGDTYWAEKDFTQTETIGDITIAFCRADDGHKICLPDQESKIMDLYESTGVAWYYLLDTENKQFKLPRSKHNKYADTLGVVGNGMALGVTTGELDRALGSTTVHDSATTNALQVSNNDPEGVKVGDSVGVSNSYTNNLGMGKAYGISTTPEKSGIIAQQTQDTDQYKYLYFYVGNYVRGLDEVDVGAITETINSLTAQISALQAENQAMMGRMDFAKAVEVRVDATTTSYTVPSDGYIQFSTTNANSGAIYINDAYFCHITSVSNGNAGLIPVTAGDVLSTNTESGWVYMTFIPQKQ